MAESLRNGDDEQLSRLTQQAIDGGMSAKRIGADAYGYDAANAVGLVKELIGVA